MKRVVIPLVVALGVLAMALPGAGASAPAQRVQGLGNCGKVDDAGHRSPVKAINMTCERARAIAKDFIQDDAVRHGWKTFNPAGCEWYMFRKKAKDEFADWFVNDGVVRFRLIFFTKFRGCES
jgi:hypothetical protein